MKGNWRSPLGLVVLSALALGPLACNSRSRAQTQGDQDQETREKVADATAKAKRESEKAAQQLQVAAQQAEHEARVAGQGVKEGWDRDRQGRLDLNSASRADLRALSLSEDQTDRIVNGRPYKTKQELVTRGILTERQYDGIRDQITVQSPPTSASR